MVAVRRCISTGSKWLELMAKLMAKLMLELLCRVIWRLEKMWNECLVQGNLWPPLPSSPFRPILAHLNASRRHITLCIPTQIGELPCDDTGPD